MDKLRLQALSRYERFKDSSVKPSSRILRRLARNLGFMTRFIPTAPSPDPCDVLFLHLFEGQVARIAHLSRALEARAIQVRHQVITPAEILRKRLLATPDTAVPREFLLESALARYLVTKYRPRVLCTFMDAVPLSSFLSHELLGKGRSINIAHCITDSSYLFSMFDFDYYFIFGRGSLENIAVNPLRIGNTKVVLTGSPFIDPGFTMEPNHNRKNLLFFSAHTPGPIREVMVNTMKMVIRWAGIHPEFSLHVKLHPIEDPSFFAGMAQGVPNITILPKETGMYDALRDVSLVLSNFSSASIEAALLNRPTVIASTRGFPNFFRMEDFFLPRATDPETLHDRITTTLDNYEHFLKKTREFTDFHLEHKTDSVSFMADCIESILEGKEEFETIPVKEKLIDPNLLR